MEFRLVSYNIRFSGQGRVHLLGEVLRSIEPDLVILQEAKKPNAVQRLAHVLSMPYCAVSEGRSLALLARLPLVHHNWHRTKRMEHAFLEVRVEKLPLRVFGVHLHPHFSKRDEQSRIQEIGFLLEAIDTHRTPHLLIGDFNAVAPGDTVRFERLPGWIKSLIRLRGGEIHHEAIRMVLEAGYADGFRWLYPEEEGFTFPTGNPNVRFDYIFLPSSLLECLKECTVVEEPGIVSQASDHYPLLAVLEI